MPFILCIIIELKNNIIMTESIVLSHKKPLTKVKGFFILIRRGEPHFPYPSNFYSIHTFLPAGF